MDDLSGIEIDSGETPAATAAIQTKDEDQTTTDDAAATAPAAPAAGGADSDLSTSALAQ